MKPDIETRADLERLLDEFYAVATSDAVIGHHFAELDLAAHLPVIVDFWDKLLFGRPIYFGNPLQVHQRIHVKAPLLPEHFARWVEIFTQTADALFEGEKADEAKRRAAGIAENLSARLAETVTFGVAIAPR
jgi:hemoglobin